MAAGRGAGFLGGVGEMFAECAKPINSSDLGRTSSDLSGTLGSLALMSCFLATRGQRLPKHQRFAVRRGILNFSWWWCV